MQEVQEEQKEEVTVPVTPVKVEGPPTLLVVGGTGFFGSNFVNQFLQSGQTKFAKIVILDNFQSSSVSRLNLIEEASQTKLDLDFDFVECDVSNYSQLSEVFKSHSKVHTVAHFAQGREIGAASAYPLECYDQQVSGVVALLKVMKEEQCLNIVYCSSAHVYRTKQKPTTNNSQQELQEQDFLQSVE